MGDEARYLIELLEAYSPSGDEARGVEAFGRIAKELGYAVERDAAGNGIARIGSGRPQVMFLGHIDTVPGAIPVRRSGERIRGRGACDAKGPILAALLGVADRTIAGEAVVVAAVGEETDSRGARHLLDRWHPDAVIAGEPNGWNGIAVGYKGDLRLLARFDGKRRHLSSPEASTAERAMDWVQSVRGLARRGPDAFHSTTTKLVSFTTEAEGGSESVRAEIDLRLPPGGSVESVRAEIERLSAPAHLEVEVSIEAFEADRTSPVVRALIAGIRGLGAQPTLWRKGGTSDLNLVAPAWGVPGAAYGPGDPHLDHTDDEALDLEELVRASGVLRAAFGELRGRASTTPRRSAAGAG